MACQKFVFYLNTGTIRRVVLPRPYFGLGRISKNGRYVPCHAFSKDLGTPRARIARCDLETGQVLPILEVADSQVTESFLVRFSADGSVAAFAFVGNIDGSTPGFAPYLNVYSWHAATGQIRLLSESRSGFPAVSLGAARVSISEDGKMIDVFVKNLGPIGPPVVVAVPVLTPNGSVLFAGVLLTVGMWVTRRNSA